MDPNKPKERRAWQPRISEDREFNPFVRPRSPDTSIDNRTLEEIDAEAAESEAREDEAEPIKVPETTGPNSNQ